MHFTFRLFSTRWLATAAVLSGATLFVAVGCGGGSSSSGSSGGSGGSSGDATTGGDTTSGGDSSNGGTSNGGASHGGASNGGSSAAGEAGALGEGGAAGEGPITPAQNTSAVAFVSAATKKSTSNNFVLIGNLGESLGGTVGSKRSKSLKYTYIPGVIAGTSP